MRGTGPVSYTHLAALQLKLSEDSFKKKQSAEIARAQLQIRERVSGLSEELKAKLFTEVRDKLERYIIPSLRSCIRTMKFQEAKTIHRNR